MPSRMTSPSLSPSAAALSRAARRQLPDFEGSNSSRRPSRRVTSALSGGRKRARTRGGLDTERSQTEREARVGCCGCKLPKRRGEALRGEAEVQGVACQEDRRGISTLQCMSTVWTESAGWAVGRRTRSPLPAMQRVKQAKAIPCLGRKADSRQKSPHGSQLRATSMLANSLAGFVEPQPESIHPRANMISCGHSAQAELLAGGKLVQHLVP